MSLSRDSEVRKVTGITEAQERRICDFLQGAVYCWCKNRSGEWFSMRDLMGGDNNEWAGTPLFVLYQKHEDSSDDPVRQAGRDSGWLLKKVVREDERRFDTREANLIREYRWID